MRLTLLVLLMLSKGTTDDVYIIPNGLEAYDASAHCLPHSLLRGSCMPISELSGTYTSELQRIEAPLCNYLMVQHSPACQGFIYIVLLRFLIGPCVWCAVLLVQLSLILGGAACYIKSFQCAGHGLSMKAVTKQRLLQRLTAAFKDTKTRTHILPASPRQVDASR